MDKKVTYDLVARYFTGNCNNDENFRVECWRDSNSDNLDAFNQYRAIWENARQPEVVFSPNVANALKKVNQKLSPGSTGSKSGKVIPFLTYTRRIAAAILVGAGIWLAYTLLHTKQENVLLVAESGNSQKEVELNDGTHIWLNANTRLRYPGTFKGAIRKIYIEGEAYFDVAKNPEMPFVIETEQSVITVLGTEFNLRARKTDPITVVTVTEGKVSFAAKALKTRHPLYLLAGDKGMLNTGKQELISIKNQNPNFLAWKTRKLVFKNTPLERVASDLSDYFNTRVLVGNSARAQTPFTSTFEQPSLKDILSIMELSLGVKADTTHNTVFLK
jgi:ferric-dicitrate binding protein FerR (iron transport regulator)